MNPPAAPAFDDFAPAAPRSRVWPVGALCRAVADALEARFNPVSVAGEIVGWSAAASGHCYFSLRDEAGQIRCAMFRRAAQSLGFSPREGDRVVAHGRLGVYETRGDLQLIVERLERAGQGALMEQFLRLKAQLEAEGLFDNARKRPLRSLPRALGVVCSPQAAAWHDVMTALQRRAPHVRVLLAPSLVQGAGAAEQLVQALQRLYDRAEALQLDAILLVRGGGALEDLWAFNDEALVRAIVRSPVPVISGVGHETDFTLADFAADVRAPTPTAAAELAAAPQADALAGLAAAQRQLQRHVQRQIDQRAQRIDQLAAHLLRPSVWLTRQNSRLAQLQQRLQHATTRPLQLGANALAQSHMRLQHAVQAPLQQGRERCTRAALSLELLAPQRVLERGYAMVKDAHGLPITRTTQAQAGQAVDVVLADGVLGARIEQVTPTAPKGQARAKSSKKA